MKNNEDKLRNWIIKQRVYFQYGSGWVSSFQIGFIFAVALENVLKPVFPISLLLIYPTCLFGVWLIGFVMCQRNWLADEQDMKIRMNPLFYWGLDKQAKKNGVYEK